MSSILACHASDARPLPAWAPDEFTFLLGLIQQSSLTAGVIVRWGWVGLVSTGTNQQHVDKTIVRR